MDFIGSTCVLSGAMRTFTSCALDGNAITIITDQDHVNTSDQLVVYIDNILNPVGIISTDHFTIVTTYDGIIVD